MKCSLQDSTSKVGDLIRYGNAKNNLFIILHIARDNKSFLMISLEDCEEFIVSEYWGNLEFTLVCRPGDF